MDSSSVGFPSFDGFDNPAGPANVASSSVSFPSFDEFNIPVASANIDSSSVAFPSFDDFNTLVVSAEVSFPPRTDPPKHTAPASAAAGVEFPSFEQFSISPELDPVFGFPSVEDFEAEAGGSASNPILIDDFPSTELFEAALGDSSATQ